MKKKANRPWQSLSRRTLDAFRGLMLVIYEESSLYVIFTIIFIALLTGGVLHRQMQFIH